MEKESTDYVCNLDCPVKDGIPYCCRNCREARKNFVNDANRHLWGNKGFHSESGCRLLRKDMPLECKEYDCRRYTFKINRVWAGKWRDIRVYENNS